MQFGPTEKFSTRSGNAVGISCGPGGLVFSCINLDSGNKVTLSVWINCGGIVCAGRIVVSEFIPVSDIQQCHMVWRCTGDRICLLVGGTVLIIKVVWENCLTGEYMSFQDAITHAISGDGHTSVHLVKVKMDINRKLPFPTASSICSIIHQSTPFICIGSAHSTLQLINWKGDNRNFVSFSHEHILCPYPFSDVTSSSTGAYPLSQDCIIPLMYSSPAPPAPLLIAEQLASDRKWDGVSALEWCECLQLGCAIHCDGSLNFFSPFEEEISKLPSDAEGISRSNLSNLSSIASSKDTPRGSRRPSVSSVSDSVNTFSPAMPKTSFNIAVSQTRIYPFLNVLRSSQSTKHESNEGSAGEKAVWTELTRWVHVNFVERTSLSTYPYDSLSNQASISGGTSHSNPSMSRNVARLVAVVQTRKIPSPKLQEYSSGCSADGSTETDGNKSHFRKCVYSIVVLKLTKEVATGAFLTVGDSSSQVGSVSLEYLQQIAIWDGYSIKTAIRLLHEICITVVYPGNDADPYLALSIAGIVTCRPIPNLDSIRATINVRMAPAGAPTPRSSTLTPSSSASGYRKFRRLLPCSVFGRLLLVECDYFLENYPGVQTPRSPSKLLSPLLLFQDEQRVISTLLEASDEKSENGDDDVLETGTKSRGNSVDELNSKKLMDIHSSQSIRRPSLLPSLSVDTKKPAEETVPLPPSVSFIYAIPLISTVTNSVTGLQTKLLIDISAGILLFHSLTNNSYGSNISMNANGRDNSNNRFRSPSTSRRSSSISFASGSSYLSADDDDTLEKDDDNVDGSSDDSDYNSDSSTETWHFHTSNINNNAPATDAKYLRRIRLPRKLLSELVIHQLWSSKRKISLLSPQQLKMKKVEKVESAVSPLASVPLLFGSLTIFSSPNGRHITCAVDVNTNSSLASAKDTMNQMQQMHYWLFDAQLCKWQTIDIDMSAMKGMDHTDVPPQAWVASPETSPLQVEPTAPILKTPVKGARMAAKSSVSSGSGSGHNVKFPQETEPVAPSVTPMTQRRAVENTPALPTTSCFGRLIRIVSGLWCGDHTLVFLSLRQIETVSTTPKAPPFEIHYCIEIMSKSSARSTAVHIGEENNHRNSVHRTLILPANYTPTTFDIRYHEDRQITTTGGASVSSPHTTPVKSWKHLDQRKQALMSAMEEGREQNTGGKSASLNSDRKASSSKAVADTKSYTSLPYIILIGNGYNSKAFLLSALISAASTSSSTKSHTTSYKVPPVSPPRVNMKIPTAFSPSRPAATSNTDANSSDDLNDERSIFSTVISSTDRQLYCPRDYSLSKLWDFNLTDTVAVNIQPASSPTPHQHLSVKYPVVESLLIVVTVDLKDDGDAFPKNRSDVFSQQYHILVRDSNLNIFTVNPFLRDQWDFIGSYYERAIVFDDQWNRKNDSRHFFSNFMSSGGVSAGTDSKGDNDTKDLNSESMLVSGDILLLIANDQYVSAANRKKSKRLSTAANAVKSREQRSRKVNLRSTIYVPFSTPSKSVSFPLPTASMFSPVLSVMSDAEHAKTQSTISLKKKLVRQQKKESKGNSAPNFSGIQASYFGQCSGGIWISLSAPVLTLPHNAAPFMSQFTNPCASITVQSESMSFNIFETILSQTRQRSLLTSTNVSEGQTSSGIARSCRHMTYNQIDPLFSHEHQLLLQKAALVAHIHPYSMDLLVSCLEFKMKLITDYDKFNSCVAEYVCLVAAISKATSLNHEMHDADKCVTGKDKKSFAVYVVDADGKSLDGGGDESLTWTTKRGIPATDGSATSTATNPHTGTSNENSLKASNIVFAETSIVGDNMKQLEFCFILVEVLSRLGRKLEPFIRHQLFPIPSNLFTTRPIENWSHPKLPLPMTSAQERKVQVTTPFSLFKHCLRNSSLLHASRLLTLACDHLGGSEDTAAAIVSLVLSLELLYHCLRHLSVTSALECFSFCCRLETIIVQTHMQALEELEFEGKYGVSSYSTSASMDRPSEAVQTPAEVPSVSSSTGVEKPKDVARTMDIRPEIRPPPLAIVEHRNTESDASPTWINLFYQLLGGNAISSLLTTVMGDGVEGNEKLMKELLNNHEDALEKSAKSPNSSAAADERAKVTDGLLNHINIKSDDDTPFKWRAFMILEEQLSADHLRSLLKGSGSCAMELFLLICRNLLENKRYFCCATMMTSLLTFAKSSRLLADRMRYVDSTFENIASSSNCGFDTGESQLDPLDADEDADEVLVQNCIKAFKIHKHVVGASFGQKMTQLLQYSYIRQSCEQEMRVDESSDSLVAMSFPMLQTTTTTIVQPIVPTEGNVSNPTQADNSSKKVKPKVVINDPYLNRVKVLLNIDLGAQEVVKEECKHVDSTKSSVSDQQVPLPTSWKHSLQSNSINTINLFDVPNTILSCQDSYSSKVDKATEASTPAQADTANFSFLLRGLGTVTAILGRLRVTVVIAVMLEEYSTAAYLLYYCFKADKRKKDQTPGSVTVCGQSIVLPTAPMSEEAPSPPARYPCCGHDCPWRVRVPLMPLVTCFITSPVFTSCMEDSEFSYSPTDADESDEAGGGCVCEVPDSDPWELEDGQQEGAPASEEGTSGDTIPPLPVVVVTAIVKQMKNIHHRACCDGLTTKEFVGEIFSCIVSLEKEYA